MYSFEYPWALLTIFIFVGCHVWCKEQSDSIYFPHVKSLILSQKKSLPWLDILKWIGIVSAVIALASPVTNQYIEFDKKNGRDIVLVLDASESMLESIDGFGGNLESKFDATKKTIVHFIDSRKNDRIGLVTFADAVFSASPLTFDKKFVKDILEMQSVGIAGRRTAINDAITQSLKMLASSQSKSKVIILLTDGMDNQSAVEYDEVLRILSKSNIKLYSIGFGTNGDYDKEYLYNLAKATNGKFFEASDNMALKKIYQEIDKLETSKLDVKPKNHYKYLYIYPLFLAWMCLTLWIYFRNTRGI